MLGAPSRSDPRTRRAASGPSSLLQTGPPIAHCALVGLAHLQIIGPPQLAAAGDGRGMRWSVRRPDHVGGGGVACSPGVARAVTSALGGRTARGGVSRPRCRRRPGRRALAPGVRRPRRAGSPRGAPRLPRRGLAHRWSTPWSAYAATPGSLSVPAPRSGGSGRHRWRATRANGRAGTAAVIVPDRSWATSGPTGWRASAA
jgi:hypothetical protein